MPTVKQKHRLRSLSVLTVLAILACTADGAYASSWSPTLLVNTEAFQVIDDSDASANLYIQFGGTLQKKLTYDRTGAQFQFDDDLEIFGMGSGQWLHAQDRLSSSGALTIDGSSVYFNAFANCTALETVNGLLTCGSDDGGGASPGQGITVNGTVVSLAASHSGTTIEGTTLLSGATIHAQDMFHSSGSLLVDGSSVYFNSFANCTALETVNGLLTCGTDDLGGGSVTPGQGITIAGSNVRLTAAHSGTIIEATSLLSGATVHAEGQLQSSGSLVAEGTTAFNNIKYTWPTSIPPNGRSSGALLTLSGSSTNQLSWTGPMIKRNSLASTGTGSAGPFTTWQNLTANSADCTTTALCPAVMRTSGVGIGTWKYRYTVIYQSAATTTGIGFAVDHTGTVGQVQHMWYHITTGGTAATGVGDNDTATSAGQMAEGKHEGVDNTIIGSVSAGVGAVNSDVLAIVEGIIVVTAAAPGTDELLLLISSEVASSAVRIMADSTLELMKIE